MTAPYRSLLCSTDLSAASDEAVALAYALAAPGATVHLLHVCEPGFVVSPFDLSPVAALPRSAEAIEALERKSVEHLVRLVPEGASTRGLTTQTHVVHGMDPASTIERVARELNVEVIVLGTHGRTGVGRLVMGSVANDVARRVRLPVVLYRAPRP